MKEKEIGLFQKIISDLQSLDYLDWDNLDFVKGRLKSYIKNIFGEKSDYLIDMSNISFGEAYQSAIFDVPFTDRCEVWGSGQKRMINLCNTIIEELTIFNDRKSIIPANGANSDPKKVFVVHGRNIKARDALFNFLRSLKLEPLEWSELIIETGKGTPYIGEVLDTAFSIAQAVVVLMTPDDEACLREPYREISDPIYEMHPSPQARPNVLFEAGMAIGRFPDRTILIELGSLRPFSDIAGKLVVRLNNSTGRRQELAQRLKIAGCKINLDGTDWHNTGDFDSSLK